MNNHYFYYYIDFALNHTMKTYCLDKLYNIEVMIELDSNGLYSIINGEISDLGGEIGNIFRK